MTPKSSDGPLSSAELPAQCQLDIQDLLRSVASSTAIETGDSVAYLEKKLLDIPERLRLVKLA